MVNVQFYKRAGRGQRIRVLLLSQEAGKKKNLVTLVSVEIQHCRCDAAQKKKMHKKKQKHHWSWKKLPKDKFKEVQVTVYSTRRQQRPSSGRSDAHSLLISMKFNALNYSSEHYLLRSFFINSLRNVNVINQLYPMRWRLTVPRVKSVCEFLTKRWKPRYRDIVWLYV